MIIRPVALKNSRALIHGAAASGALRALQPISEDSDERVAWEELEEGATLAPHAAFFFEAPFTACWSREAIN